MKKRTPIEDAAVAAVEKLTKDVLIEARMLRRSRYGCFRYKVDRWVFDRFVVALNDLDFAEQELASIRNVKRIAREAE